MKWLHIHRWGTVERLTYAEYVHRYRSPDMPPPPKNPIPPGCETGMVTGMLMQECRCGARRSEREIGPFPPIDSWTRP